MKTRKIKITIIMILTFILFQASLCTKSNDKKADLGKQIIKTISSKEAYSMMKKNKDNPDLIIIDVRTEEEYLQERIQKAINVDYYSEDFAKKLSDYDKDKLYLIHCRSGNRSSKALRIMKELGFKEVYDFGGIIQWKAEGYPLEQ